MRNSWRASAMPAHMCGPRPKARCCRMFGRRSRNWSASGKWIRRDSRRHTPARWAHPAGSPPVQFHFVPRGTREAAIGRIQAQEFLHGIGNERRIATQLLLQRRIARQVHGDAAEQDGRRHEPDDEHLAHATREQRFGKRLALVVPRREQRAGRDRVRDRAARAGVPRSLRRPCRRAVPRRRRRWTCRRIPRLSHRPAPFSTTPGLLFGES